MYQMQSSDLPKRQIYYRHLKMINKAFVCTNPVFKGSKSFRPQGRTSYTRFGNAENHQAVMPEKSTGTYGNKNFVYEVETRPKFANHRATDDALTLKQLCPLRGCESL